MLFKNTHYSRGGAVKLDGLKLTLECKDKAVHMVYTRKGTVGEVVQSPALQEFNRLVDRLKAANKDAMQKITKDDGHDVAEVQSGVDTTLNEVWSE